MSRSQREPVSLLDTVWKPGVVLAPSGKPLRYDPHTERLWINSKRAPRNRTFVPSKTQALESYVSPFHPHQSKNK